MRFFFYIVFIILVISCGKEAKHIDIESKIEKFSVTDKFNSSEILNEYVTNFPKINDSIQLITTLYNAFKLSSVSEFTSPVIKFSGKVKLHGSKKTYFLIDYVYNGQVGAEYPWRHQFLLTENGDPVRCFSAYRYELVTIFNDKNPYLLIVNSTYKGNGKHEFYCFDNEKLVNVFDGFSDSFPRTYDAHEDNNLNEPNELNFYFSDRNSDSLNDIIFNGSIIHLGYKGNKQIPVEYIFLFDKESGHFKESENYYNKYRHLETDE